jgi:paraquat-inducible protein B
MSDAQAEVGERRRISAIWIVPLVALFVGLWLVIYTLQSQGPQITIVFSSAEGIEAGTTKIRMLNVEVGIVESVGLSDGLDTVVVTAQLDQAAAPLLREDTEFWVVRPRIGTAGVSGLGTLLSGGYIQLDPGKGEPGRREFSGVDEPPVTPIGTPGLHFGLVSDRAGSVGTGDPILYKGFTVGGIESAEFDVASQQMRYRAFIEAPYEEVVTTNTRFWNASGISLSATADGIEVSTGSLESILVGGVTLGLPEGVDAGDPVQDEVSFELYPDFTSVNEQPYKNAIDYVVEFSQSVRGLRTGAPVEYRGVRIGRVERVLLEAFAAGIRGRGSAIPILIRLEPGRLALPDTEQGAERLRAIVKTVVGNGMRATLETGNLLTGSLYIALDVYAGAAPAELGRFAGRTTIPTIGSGFAGIQQKLASTLDKLNALPLGRTVAEATRTLAGLNAILESQSMQALPESLGSTLDEFRSTLASVSADSELQERLLRTIGELDRTLESLRGVLETLDEQPNSLIFNREPGEDPRPSSGLR